MLLWEIGSLGMSVTFVVPGCISKRTLTSGNNDAKLGFKITLVFLTGGSPYPSVPVERLYDLLVGGYRMSCPAACPRRLYE